MKIPSMIQLHHDVMCHKSTAIFQRADHRIRHYHNPTQSSIERLVYTLMNLNAQWSPCIILIGWYATFTESEVKK